MLLATGTTTNKVVIVFEGHGRRGHFVPRGEDPISWDQIGSWMDNGVLDAQGNPLYSMLLVIVQSCYSGYVTSHNPFTQHDPEHRIIIASTTEDDTSNIVFLWTLFMDPFMNPLEGDWGACAESFYEEFLLHFSGTLLGFFIVALVILGEEAVVIGGKLICAFLEAGGWAIFPGVLLGSLILGLIAGTLAAYGTAGGIPSTEATIKSAYEHANFRAKQGMGIFSGFYGTIDYPQICDIGNLAKETKL